MKLVITADDFGAAPEVNAAIAESFRIGLIDRTTALANAPCFPESCTLAFERGFQDKVGIHFNLTNGPALSPLMAAAPGFCDGSGHFTYRRNSKAYVTRAEREALADECERQVSRLHEAGLRPTYFDSHHHVHTEWFIFQAIEPVLKRWGFSSVRISKNLGHSSFARSAYKSIFNLYLKRSRLNGTDYFGDYREVLAWLSTMKDGRDCRVEVMTHPRMDCRGVIVDTCSGGELQEAICRLRTGMHEPERESALV